MSVLAKGPAVSEVEELRRLLAGRWREALRAVMVLLSLQQLSPAQIAELLDCHPSTVRRWIGRFNRGGVAAVEPACPDAVVPGRADRHSGNGFRVC